MYVNFIDKKMKNVLKDSDTKFITNIFDTKMITVMMVILIK